jgi:FkbM family methyltransferase
MTVVDGGAHVGVYTRLAADRVGPRGLVLSIEPDRYNLSALECNVGSRTNVRIVPKALAEGPGVAEFHVSSSTIGSSLLPRDDAESESVELTSVDAELAGLHVDSLLVKLNIEGAEPRAIAGMVETLERVRRVTLLVEINPAVLDAPDALAARLRELGFVLYTIDLSSQSLFRLDGTPQAKGHLFCVRC